MFQNIREQMAISLKRMRELEDQVKIIPSLEVELQSLKDEKYELIEKLAKLKSTLRQAEFHLNQMKNNEKKEIQTRVVTIESKPTLRDVGISCRTLTRDVGVTPVILKNRTVGTETITDFLFPANGTVKEETIKPLFKSTKSQIQPDIQNRSTITDLYMKDIMQIFERRGKQLSEKHLDGISLLPKILERVSKGVQASVKDPVPVLQVIEKREAGVQVAEAKKQSRDVGFTVKTKTYDASTDARPKTREFGSSDDRITDVLCDKCKYIKTRSVGVGLGNIKLEEPKIETSILNRSKSFQLSESKPLVSSRTIGVGTMIPVKKLTSTKGVGTTDIFGVMTSKNSGVNTERVLFVDVGVGSESSNNISICEKCKNEAKLPQKPSPTQREVGEGHSQPSRIPRPKSNQTTPVMERKKFMRQDTYTKIPSQPFNFEALKKTKPGYV